MNRTSSHEQGHRRNYLLLHTYCKPSLPLLFVDGKSDRSCIRMDTAEGGPLHTTDSLEAWSKVLWEGRVQDDARGPVNSFRGWGEGGGPALLSAR